VEINPPPRNPENIRQLLSQFVVFAKLPPKEVQYRFWRALSLHMVLLLKIEEQSVKKRRGKQEERKRREKKGEGRRKEKEQKKKGKGKEERTWKGWTGTGI